jgi:hypothetical protein
VESVDSKLRCPPFPQRYYGCHPYSTTLQIVLQKATPFSLTQRSARAGEAFRCAAYLEIF